MTPSDEAKVTTIATRFARSLDRSHWAEARAMLAAQCEYFTGTETLRSADEIVASYRQAAERAAEHLDSVRYESQLDGVAGREATVLFVDRIEHGGQQHDYRTRQVLTVGPDGKIHRIVNRESGDERRRLEEFFKRCHVTWPPAAG